VVVLARFSCPLAFFSPRFSARESRERVRDSRRGSAGGVVVAAACAGVTSQREGSGDARPSVLAVTDHSGGSKSKFAPSSFPTLSLSAVSNSTSTVPNSVFTPLFPPSIVDGHGGRMGWGARRTDGMGRAPRARGLFPRLFVVARRGDAGLGAGPIQKRRPSQSRVRVPLRPRTRPSAAMARRGSACPQLRRMRIGPGVFGTPSPPARPPGAPYLCAPC